MSDTLADLMLKNLSEVFGERDSERRMTAIKNLYSGMTGLELHGRLAQSGNAIPTVLITAYPDEKVRARALQAGVVCYLSKPFNEDELLECIQSALEQGATRSKSS